LKIAEEGLYWTDAFPDTQLTMVKRWKTK